MPRTTNTAPSGGFTNLTAPRFVLAPPGEFIYDANGPVAQKLMFGALWCGLNAMGETLKVSVKREGSESNLANGSGGSRGKQWTMPGWSADIELQHDRGMPLLDLGDMITMWVRAAEDDAGDQLPVKLRFYISAVGNDMGDSETASYKITVRYEEGLMDNSSLVRAKVDQFGRVITWDDSVRVEGSATAPGSALPSAPA